LQGKAHIRSAGSTTDLSRGEGLLRKMRKGGNANAAQKDKWKSPRGAESHRQCEEKPSVNRRKRVRATIGTGPSGAAMKKRAEKPRKKTKSAGQA